MIKLVFIDLDKTLLRSDKTISDYTMDVFLQLRNEGIKTIINTARRYEISQPILKKIQGSGLICCNGAMVYCDGELIAKYDIDRAKVNALFHEIIGSVPLFRWSVAYVNNTYTNYDDPYYIKIDSYKELPEENPLMIILRNIPYEKYQCFYSVFGQQLYIKQLEKRNVLVTSNYARKDKAMELIMKHYNVSTDEVAAFGDDINDIDFMVKAGISIAVNNADDNVKRIADYICPSNDCDGVARWLEKFCATDGKIL